MGKVKQKVHCTWYSMAISHIRLCLRIISFALYIRAVFGTSIAVHLAAILYTKGHPKLGLETDIFVTKVE